MIRYSSRAQRARAFLQRPFNDLDVFVEDLTCQNAYVRLINRFLAGKGRVLSVFPLGDKAAVISACAADQTPRGRPRLYLIDGDVDLILKKGQPGLAYLYRLNVYCFENLLVDEAAFVEIAQEASTTEDALALKARLGIDAFLLSIAGLLPPLFAIYALSQAAGTGDETAGYSVFRLCTDSRDPRTLSRRLLRLRALQIIGRLRATLGRQNYRARRNTVSRRLSKQGLAESLKGVSGKSYILPLIQTLLQREAGLRESSAGLKVRLAALCRLDADPSLGKALRKALKGS